MLKYVSFLLLGLALISFSSFYTTPKKPAEVVFLMPPSDLKYFTLGYREILADVLWLRVIQDFDFCENTKNRHSEFTPGAVKNDQCKMGWVYHMIDAVTELAPKFRIAYSAGATMLATVVNDAVGAGKIFDKGIEQFPTFWPLLYYGAYNAMANLHEHERAADLLVRAGKNGAPFWVMALAGRLYTKAGKALFAKKVLEGALEEYPDERFRDRIKERLDAINQDLKASGEAEAPQPSSK